MQGKTCRGLADGEEKTDHWFEAILQCKDYLTTTLKKCACIEGPSNPSCCTGF